MNCMVRNTLFRNPATQFLDVLFTTTHKEPEIRQSVRNPEPAAVMAFNSLICPLGPILKEIK